KLTPLEYAILSEYYKAFSAQGFPSPDQIEVLERDNTGAGRFVELRPSIATKLQGSTCDLERLKAVEMDGVPLGLGWVLFMKNGSLECLELFTYGGDWDGEERPWRLVE
ncbi:unnamed protein product, partial [Phaeothamnion confervicola]